jgi:hypothetical protein
MKNNFPKIPFFISLAFFIFSCGIFFYFLRGINNLNNKTQLAETTWNTENLRRNEIKTLDQSINDIQDQTTALTTHFAQSSDVVPFLNTIESLATEAGATAIISSVDVSTDNTSLMVALKATGTFPNIYKFITLLENSPYELQFEGMDLQNTTSVNTSGKTTTTSNWNATFNIKLISFIN